MNSADERRAGNTRRSFLEAGTAAIAVSGAAFGRPAGETLAVDGGPRAVTFPAARAAALSKWPRYGDEEKKRVVELLDGNGFYNEITPLERELKDYLKAPYVKAHCNGTSALLSTFFALDLPRGSEIMAPSYTAWATTAPMHLFGYVPVFVDINPHTQTFDVEYAEKHVTPLTRAVLPMHSFGNPCDMDRISAFAQKHGLILLEDAAQACGASLQGKACGTWGAIGIYSFQATKALPAIEGGAAAYQTREYYERATTFGNYELPASFPADSPYRRYQGTGFGPKLRIHPLGAALARIQLRGLDERNAMVDSQARKLADRLVELPGISQPYTRPDARRVRWASLILFLDEQKAGCPKEKLLQALQAEGVRISEGRYDEQHRYKLYSEAKWWHHPPVIPESLPGTTEVNRKAVRLPLFYDDAGELIAQYVAAFEKVWARRAALARG